jgi:CRP/FNR family cyclic AMP-dependent transcriptional regulator
MFRNPGTTLSYEDPLTYLPRKSVQEFAKRHVIYDAQRPSTSLYLIILGRVKVASTAEDGCQTIGRIVCAEGLFGESALIGQDSKSESAVALDKVTLMSWTRDEIEQQIDREPRLGLALSQYLVRQCIDLQDRIESMAVHKTPERTMLAILQLANTLGTPMADGTTRIPALTHHTLAEYVGTSREIVTFQLNRLRRVGMLRYSRKFLDVYVPAIQDSLRSQGIHLPTSTAAIRQVANRATNR